MNDSFSESQAKDKDRRMFLYENVSRSLSLLPLDRQQNEMK